MESADNFALLLPFILLTFGSAFLLVARYERRPALSWGIGYGLAAAAFAGPALRFWVPVPAVALACDALFIGAFYFYGQAMLERFRRPPYRLVRGGLALAGLAAAVYADLIAGNLELELLFNDLATVLLLLVPLLLCLRHARHWLDVVLLVLAGMVTVETVLRNIFLVLLAQVPGSLADFATSEYAGIMRMTASAIGLLLALTALATVALDVLARYRHAAERDALTDMLNRRGFEQALTGIRAGQGGFAGAVIVCDIDRFKLINDVFGHQQGDRVLVAFAGVLNRYLPAQALAARFGGEEFVICLPDYALAEAEVLANMLRLAVASHGWPAIGIDRQVTASFGCAAVDASDRSIHDAIGRADANLYAAKTEGRNRVVALVGAEQRDGTGTVGKGVSVSPVRSYSR